MQDESQRVSEEDATLDILAALDMYQGSFGEIATAIADLYEDTTKTNTLVVELINGQKFSLQVREVRSA